MGHVGHDLIGPNYWQSPPVSFSSLALLHSPVTAAEEDFSLNFVFFDGRYNVVFKYLLSVRRVQAELQHCWALQMQRKHLKSNRTDAIKWRLRDHMAFLVDNLQYYLQVSITEKDKLYQLIRKGQKCMEGSLKICLTFLNPRTLMKIRISFASLELPPSSQTTATITEFLDL